MDELVELSGTAIVGIEHVDGHDSHADGPGGPRGCWIGGASKPGARWLQACGRPPESPVIPRYADAPVESARARAEH